MKKLMGVVLLTVLSACLPLNPMAPTNDPYAVCSQAADMAGMSGHGYYCNSYIVPQTMPNGMAGTCCISDGTGKTAYLLAYGSNRSPAGCLSDYYEAQKLCGVKGYTCNSIVQCSR